MKKYDKYKDSGIEWLGKIPEHWEVKKVKYNFSFKTGFTPPSGSREYYENGTHVWVNISDLTKKYISDSETKITDKAIEDFNPEIVHAGSLLYSFKLTVGKVAFNTIDVYTNEAIFAIAPNKRTNLNYFYYSLPQQIIYNANENIYGAKILNQELIKNAKLIIPPPKEQFFIANFLDRKTAQIDELIAKKERLLELYEEEKSAIINRAVTKGINPNVKMKDSGIEWIGEIPEHWEVKKLKYCIENIESGKREPTEFKDIYSIGGEHISPDGKIVLNNPKYVSQEFFDTHNKGKIKKNDILMVKDGATIGKVAFVDFDPKNKMMLNEHVYRIVAHKFYFYFFLSNYFQKIIWKENQSSAQEGITLNTIRNISSIFISKSNELNEIVQFIEKETARIDAKIEKTKRLIELLKEYKQAFISEAVTGKIKVV